MVRVSRYQAPRYLLDGDALGVMDVDRILECYNLYGRTRPLVLVHRDSVELIPWPTGERLELAMLDVETAANDWAMATMEGGTDTQSRFIVPGGATGWWCVSAFAAVPNPGSSTHTGIWRIEICKTPKYSGVVEYDGAQIEAAREDSMTLGTSDLECNLGCGTIMWCDEGDEVFARVLQTTGTDLTVNAPGASLNSAPDCQLSMVWLSEGSGQTLAAFTAAATLGSTAVPDEDDWTEIADQAFYVTQDRPMVKVGNTGSGTSVASGGQVAIGMNSEASFPFADLWGWHSTVTNNTRITVPSSRGGLYLVGAELAAPHGSTATYRRVLDLRLNGTTYIGREDLRQTFTGATAGPVMSVGPLLVQLGATDYLEATYFQDSGGSVTVGTTGLTYTVQNPQPVNAQLYLHQVQEGTLATTTSFSENGYQAVNTVLTSTWWNQYLRDNGVALCKDVRAASVIMSGTQSVSSGSWTSISFGAAEFDNALGAGLWASGSPTKLLVPGAESHGGWWLVGGGLEFAPTGAVRRHCALRIRKNGLGGAIVGKRGVTVESASAVSLNIPATLVNLAPSEYVEMQAYHNVGSAINVGGNTNRFQAFFWMLKICSSQAYDPA